MHLPASRILVTCVLLAVFLVSGPAGAQGLVWCIGGDGHIALEAASAGACSGASADAETGSSAAATPHWTAADDHCGPCLDLDPSLSAASGGLRSEQLLPAAVLPVFEAQRCGGLATCSEAAVLPILSPTPPDPVLRSLRTVVLLI